jgi:hypothetical protein
VSLFSPTLALESKEPADFLMKLEEQAIGILNQWKLEKLNMSANKNQKKTETKNEILAAAKKTDDQNPCAKCGTTKLVLKRKGPNNMILCNACGISYSRKRTVFDGTKFVKVVQKKRLLSEID